MDITVNTYTESMVGEMIGIYTNLQTTKKWEKVKLKEDTELYMNAQAGELSLENQQPDMEWETYKSTSANKVAYYCEQKKEWHGPAKPKEEEYQGSDDSSRGEENMTIDINSWKSNGHWKERRIGGVRVLHSFRRHKTVFQGNPREAVRMLDILEEVAEQEEGKKVRMKFNESSEYTERTKKTRDVVKQTRSEPIKSFLATMEMLEQENLETPEE